MKRLAQFRQQQAGLGWTFAISLPAAACAQLGYSGEGLALVQEAFDAAERHGDYFWEWELHRLKGDLLLARSAVDEAEACYRLAATVAERQGARFLALRAVISLARLHRQQGRNDTSIRLQSLSETFAEGFDTDDLRNARLELALSAGIAPTG